MNSNIKMKGEDLIKLLEKYKDFYIKFNIDCVNMELEEPYCNFPYQESLNEVEVVDVCYSESIVSLGFNDKKIFHLVKED